MTRNPLQRARDLLGLLLSLAIAGAGIAVLSLAVVPGDDARADRVWLGDDSSKMDDLEEIALVSMYEFGAGGSAELALMELPSGGSGFDIGSAGNIACTVPLGGASVAGSVQIHPTGRRAYVGTNLGIAVIAMTGSGLGSDEQCSCSSGNVCIGLERMHTIDVPQPYSLRISPDGNYLMAFGVPGGRQQDMEGASVSLARGVGFVLSTQLVGGLPVRPCPPLPECDPDDPNPDTDTCCTLQDQDENGGACPQDPLCVENREQLANARLPLEGRTTFNLSLGGLDQNEVVMDTAWSPDGRRMYVLTSVSYASVFYRCFRNGGNINGAGCPGSDAYQSSGNTMAHLGIYDAETTAPGSFGIGSMRVFKKLAQVNLGMKESLMNSGNLRPLSPDTGEGTYEWKASFYHRESCADLETWRRARCVYNPFGNFDAAESVSVSPRGDIIAVTSHGLTRRANGLRAYDTDFRNSGGTGLLDNIEIERKIAAAFPAVDPTSPAGAGGAATGAPTIDASEVLLDFIAKEVPDAQYQRRRMFVSDVWIEGFPILPALCLMTALMGFAAFCVWALVGLAIIAILAATNWMRILPFDWQPVRVTGIASAEITPDGESLYQGARNTDNFSVTGGSLTSWSNNDPGVSGRNWSVDFAELHAASTYFESAVSAMTWAVFVAIVVPGMWMRVVPGSINSLYRDNIEDIAKWRRRFYRGADPSLTGLPADSFDTAVGASGRWQNRFWDREDAAAAADWFAFDTARNMQVGLGKSVRFAFTKDWAVIYSHGDLSHVRKLRLARRSALEGAAASGGSGLNHFEVTPTGHGDGGSGGFVGPFINTWDPIETPLQGNDVVIPAPDVLAPESEVPVVAPNSDSCTNCEPQNGGSYERTKVGWVATMPETDFDEDGFNNLTEAYNGYIWYTSDGAQDASPGSSAGQIPGLRSNDPTQSLMAAWISEPFRGNEFFKVEERMVLNADPLESNNYDTGNDDFRVHGGAGVEYGERLDCWYGHRTGDQSRAVHYIGGPGCDDCYDGNDLDGQDGCYRELEQLEGDPSEDSWAPQRKPEFNTGTNPMMPVGMFIPSRGIGYHHPPRGDLYLTDQAVTPRALKAITRVFGRYALRFPEGPPGVVEDGSRIGGGQFSAQRPRTVNSGRIMLPAMHHTHFMGVEVEIGYWATPRGGCADENLCASQFPGGGGDEETFEVGRHPAERWHPNNAELIAYFAADDLIERININTKVLNLIAGDLEASPSELDITSIFSGKGPGGSDLSKIQAHSEAYQSAMSVVVEKVTEMRLENITVTIERDDTGEPADFKIEVEVAGSDCHAGTGRYTVVLQQNGRALRDTNGKVVVLEGSVALNGDCEGDFTIESLKDRVMGEYAFEEFEDAVRTGEPPVIGVFLERTDGDSPVGDIGEAFASTASSVTFALERMELVEGDPSDRNEDGSLAVDDVRWKLTHRSQMLDPLGIPLENARLQFFTPFERPGFQITQPDCPPGVSGVGGEGSPCCAVGECFTDENGYAYVSSFNDLRTRASLDETCEGPGPKCLMHSLSILTSQSQAQLGLTQAELAAADIPVPGEFSQKECDELKFDPIQKFVQNISQSAGQTIDSVMTNKPQNQSEQGNYFWMSYRAAMEHSNQDPQMEQAIANCLDTEDFADVPVEAKDPRHVLNLWETGKIIGTEMGRAAAVKDSVEDAMIVLNFPSTLGQMGKSIAKLALFGDRSTPKQQCTEGELGAAAMGLGYCDQYTVRCNQELAGEVGREGSLLWTWDKLRSGFSHLGVDLAKHMCPRLQDVDKLACQSSGGTHTVQTLEIAVADGTWDIDSSATGTEAMTFTPTPLPPVEIDQPDPDCETKEGEGHINIVSTVLDMIFAGEPKDHMNALWDQGKKATENDKHGLFQSWNGPVKPNLHDSVKVYFEVGYYVGYLAGWIAGEILIGLATAILTGGAALLTKAVRGIRFLGTIADNIQKVSRIVSRVKNRIDNLSAVRKSMKVLRNVSMMMAVWGAFEDPANGGLIEIIGSRLGNYKAINTLEQNATQAYLGEDTSATDSFADSITSMFLDSTDAQAHNLSVANLGPEIQHKLFTEAMAGVMSARNTESERAQRALQVITDVLKNENAMLPNTPAAAQGLGVEADGASKLDQLRDIAVDKDLAVELCQEINNKCP